MDVRVSVITHIDPNFRTYVVQSSNEHVLIEKREITLRPDGDWECAHAAILTAIAVQYGIDTTDEIQMLELMSNTIITPERQVASV